MRSLGILLGLVSMVFMIEISVIAAVAMTGNTFLNLLAISVVTYNVCDFWYQYGKTKGKKQ